MDGVQGVYAFKVLHPTPICGFFLLQLGALQFNSVLTPFAGDSVRSHRVRPQFPRMVPTPYL